MCGTPHRSRTTRTGALRPGTSIVPDTSAMSGRGGCSRAQPLDAKTAETAKNARKRSRLRRMAIKDGLLADYDHEMGTTRKLLERVPDDRLAWKPHPKSMSLGGLATHLSNIPHWGGTILNESSFDLAAAPPNLQEKTSRADILESFDATCRK